MNQKAKIAAFAGLNLVLGVTGVAASSVGTQADVSPRAVLQSDTREFEASFLQVSANCKSSHAAFDAVAVALREVPAAVRAIHAEVETA